MNEDISGDTSTNRQSDSVKSTRPEDHSGTHASARRDKDVHPTDAAFWENARVILPHRKESVTIRLDADLLAWLRQQRGYQTRINAVLRAYMNAGVGDYGSGSE